MVYKKGFFFLTKLRLNTTKFSFKISFPKLSLLFYLFYYSYSVLA